MTVLIGLLAFALLVGVPALGQEPPKGSPLSTLVETERAFSRMSVAEGTRAAFLAFFADEGVNFAPGPVNTRESLLKQPAPAGPPGVILEWVPVTADVSRAGDLGYTTGPWVRSERKPGGKPLAYGWYFTVWKKQADGSWKAVADIGTTTPAHVLPGADAFRAAEGTGERGSAAPPPQRANAADILTVEQKLSDLAARSALDAYLTLATETARLHRDGAEPIVGVAAVKSHLATNPDRLTFAPTKADVSESGDLGYVYGSYVSHGIAPGAGTEKRGYYLRVWKRQAGGWRLVADITTEQTTPAP